MGKFKLRGGSGNVNPFAKMSEKGLINPLQEQGKPKIDITSLAGKDRGGLQYNLLGYRAGKKFDKMNQMEKDKNVDIYTSSKYQRISDKKQKLEDRQTKVAARREGNQKKRGIRNAIIAGTIGGLGLDFEDTPVETYTDMYIPKGMNPKDVPSYVNSISTSRSSVNNPEGVEGWVNFNMDPNKSFRYDPETGNVGFSSAQKYRETGDYINTRKKPTFRFSTAVNRVKKAADFVKRNVM
jgi:hypothetical protein